MGNSCSNYCVQVEFAAREMEHIIRFVSNKPHLIRHMILGIIGILAYLLNNLIAVIFSGGKEEPSRPLRSGAVEEEGLVHFIIIMAAV